MTATAQWTYADLARSDVLLADGTVGQLRPLTSGDRDDVQRLHEGLSPENVRLRFFSVGSCASASYVEHVLALCEDGSVLALGLWRHDRLMGLATAEVVDRESAEIAFVVSDAAKYMTATTVFVDGGIMHGSVGL